MSNWTPPPTQSTAHPVREEQVLRNRIEELHRPLTCNLAHTTCIADMRRWPCPTIRLLENTSPEHDDTLTSLRTALAEEKVKVAHVRALLGRWTRDPAPQGTLWQSVVVNELRDALDGVSPEPTEHDDYLRTRRRRETGL
jgi:hypothetical protein